MARGRFTPTQPPTAAHARRRRLANAATAIPLAIGLASTGLPSGQLVHKGSFAPGCSLPFSGVPNPAIDDHCGMQGGSSNPAKQAESRAKNNFCAAKPAAQKVSYQELIDLQTEAEKANLPQSLTDRAVLEKMGEGKYVSYVAVIRNAHYSDVGQGEAVNCNIPGESTNDIHIVLMPDPKDTDECHSTTAEISPHFRPPSWTPSNLNGLGKPVRIQGHLFYDGSHTPCKGSSRPNPKRASLWEIHPVYLLEVCHMTDLDQCRNSTNPADWVPLDKLLSSEQQ